MADEENKAVTFTETMKEAPELARALFYGLQLLPKVRLYAAAHLASSILTGVPPEHREKAIEDFKGLTKEVIAMNIDIAKQSKLTSCVICGEDMGVPKESNAVEICPACVMKGTGL